MTTLHPCYVLLVVNASVACVLQVTPQPSRLHPIKSSHSSPSSQTLPPHKSSKLALVQHVRRHASTQHTPLQQQLLLPAPPSTWTHAPVPVSRVVHTAVIEHPYDSYLRRNRERNIKLAPRRSTSEQEDKQNTQPEDPFGFKV